MPRTVIESPSAFPPSLFTPPNAELPKTESLLSSRCIVPKVTLPYYAAFLIIYMLLNILELQVALKFTVIR